ncbi:hypothetical protein [Methylotenera mobilis]|jgi:hypothetical protein|uniref:hypothetical protein n=1 Tax=Methylotenera mobilis TaxID=359408 RepID=UPI000377265E|nr:hypothetical protein [Methylotenera mobilis]
MNKIDTDSATILGMWFGIGGFITGLAGIGLTLYFSYATNPNAYYLAISGWGAAILTTVASIWVGSKLIKLVASQTEQLITLTKKHADQLITLTEKNVELQNEKERLISISEFLASKSLKTATPRKPKQEGLTNEN